jgi:dienelactone hydrolase
LSADALLADVSTYAALAPDHVSGTTDSGATQSWLRRQLHAAGLATGTDAYRFFRFVPQRVRLDLSGVPVPSVVARFYSGTTPLGGLSKPLAYASLGTAQSYAQASAGGRIAVVDAPVVDGVAATIDSAVTNAKAAGAAALVVVTEGPEDYPVQEDIDSRAGMLGMPVVFVGRRTGAQVIAAAKAGAPARLEVQADVGEGCDTNTYAVLPGADPNRYIIVGTPTSGFVPAASERGAGVAVLLALARHYAAIPRSRRPETLIFVGTTGHEDGYLGLPTFMQAHRLWFANADAYVHLGASLAARQVAEAPTGAIVRPPAGDATRLLYTSENPLLQGIVQEAFGSNRAQIASSSPGVRNVGEQVYAYHAGVPIISASGSSYYFHSAGDQPDGVSASLLAAMAAGFRDSIDGIASLPAGAVREANPIAAQLGARQQPGATPAGGSGTDIAADDPAPIPRCEPPPVRPATDAQDPASANARPTGVSAGLALVPTYDDPQPAYEWEGSWQSREFTVASRATGAMLYGTVFAPVGAKAGDNLPTVVIGPGSGPGVQAFYQWSARDLAGHGYVAVSIDPQGVGRSETFGSAGCSASDPTEPGAICPGVPFQQFGNYADGIETGIDYVLSAADPFRAAVDPSEIGVAGHSLSARAVGYLQGVDRRVKAAVAWDNLASTVDGDAGTPSGGGTAGALIGGEIPGPDTANTPRVPALGEASDSVGTTNPTDNDPDIKKTAWSIWRKAGVPSMEVVFAGASHADWGQSSLTTAAKAVEIKRFEYYTRAWFDRWLRNDPTATDRLLARTVDGTSVSSVVSTKFRSAAFLDGHDCGDLATACP